MKTNKWLSVILVAGCLIGGTAEAQQPAYQPGYVAPSPLTPDAAPEQAAPSPAPTLGVLSDWIVYRRGGCEGQPEPLTPIYTELFFQAGPSFPVGGMTLSRELQTGWSFTAGARALIFNEEQTRAWVVDAHIINTNESAGAENTAYPVTIFHNGVKTVFGPGGIPGATLQNSNRTMVGLGFGREWFPWLPADSEGRKWRLGVDAGGRYGSHRVNLNEFGHITDVVGGIYAGAHSKLEIPIRSMIWHVGVRLEWAYTWSDILQQTSDIQDINLFFTIGARY